MIWIVGFLTWALLVVLALMFFMGASMKHEDDETLPPSLGRDDIED